MKLLVIDDDENFCESLEEFFKISGYDVDKAFTASQGLAQTSLGQPDCILLDWNLPDNCGKNIIPSLKQCCPAPIIMISALPDVHNVVSALKEGADNFLYKPVLLDELLSLVRHALSLADFHKVKPLELRENKPFLRLPSQAMQDIYAQVDRIARFRDIPVLISGETGTGKEHIAKLLHEKGALPGAPLIEVNCSAIPEALFESEIFGHEAGSFTDAKKRRIGALESASGGTVFFDEVSELGLALQTKLLKVIEERTMRRVGGEKDIALDARILAASNRNLQELVRAGKFREDLFYRLNSYSITLPPLRKRPEDIVALTSLFYREACRHKELPEANPLEADFLESLKTYHWPGNVRELKNFIFRLVIDGTMDTLTQMPLPLDKLSEGFESGLPRTQKEMKLKHFEESLKRHSGNKSQAAKELGITRQTLAKWIKSGIKNNN